MSHGTSVCMHFLPSCLVLVPSFNATQDAVCCLFIFVFLVLLIWYQRRPVLTLFDSPLTVGGWAVIYIKLSHQLKSRKQLMARTQIWLYAPIPPFILRLCPWPALPLFPSSGICFSLMSFLSLRLSGCPSLCQDPASLRLYACLSFPLSLWTFPQSSLALPSSFLSLSPLLRFVGPAVGEGRTESDVSPSEALKCSASQPRVTPHNEAFEKSRGSSRFSTVCGIKH